MKAIWNGAIGFGLVNIPIKMYSATDDSNLDLDMLDSHDLSNIKFKRVNEKSGKEVKYSEIVKGYMIEAASPEKNKIFSIEQFVKEEEIDSVYFEKPYFLEPQKNGENPYRLLIKALKKTGMVGVGTFVMRDKEALALVRPYNDDVLMMNKLRFPQEIRDISELKLPAKKEPKPAELQMAISLIEQLSDKFKPEEFKDTYAEELLKIIKQKAKGKTVKRVEVKEDLGKVVDLMAQLKASLEQPKKVKKAS
jgi:DNA end-binding protein Ku